MSKKAEIGKSMRESVAERLERHPELKARMEGLLDVIENESGDVGRADEAERRAIDELRLMGRQVMQDWGHRQAGKEACGLEAKGEVVRQGKKNSTGTARSEK